MTKDFCIDFGVEKSRFSLLNTKSAGVSGRISVGASVTVVNGLVVTIYSISGNTVLSSSIVIVWFPNTFIRYDFTVRTILSQQPPFQGDLGVINFHWSVWSPYITLILSLALTNIDALSEYIVCGIPLLVEKCRKDLRKSTCLRFEVSSRCTALMAMQVYKHI